LKIGVSSNPNPNPKGICGGGSAVNAEVVRLERGWEEVGVEWRRLVWDMNERVLVGVGEAGGVAMGMGMWRERI
jgi:hypothetical protein